MSITVMQQALEALELLAKYENPLTKWPVRKPRDGGPMVTVHPHQVAFDAADALRTAIAEAEQEPVAWRGYNWSHSPDDWVYRDFDDPILDGNGNNVGQPLYTSTPQRQPLTHEQVWDAYMEISAEFDCNVVDLVEFARAIEAKLKEKNT